MNKIKIFEKCDKKNKLIQALIWIFPVLFLIDNILGFNGYQFTIAGKSIRIILFCISVFVLFLYSLAVMKKDGISLFKTKNSKTSIWKILRPFDYCVLLFMFGNALWATVIPMVVRGEMQFSLKDFSTLLVLVLYFPIAFLVRTGRFQLKKLDKMIYILSLILAVWHCVMYVGEVINPGFYESYYDFIDIISFGTAVRSDVVYGFGIVRIIQITSVFLLLGTFMAVKYLVKGKWWHIISLVVFSFAICVTYTKSIWFGYIIGLFLYLIPSFFVKIENKFQWRSIAALGIALAIIVALNFTVFNNTVFQRAFNLARSEQSIEEMQQELEEMAASGKDTSELSNKIKDALGTIWSNSLRASQNAALLKKWSESKVLGFGYGAYTEDCIRNEAAPYMYESTLPALIMKLGFVGCFIWVAFILSATVFAIKVFWKNDKNKLFLWLGIACSYGLAVQTNPLLFTFAGISMLLYLLLSPQRKLED